MLVQPLLSRRGFLAAGTASVLGFDLCSEGAPAIVTSKNKVQAASCTLAVEQTEGPFYLDGAGVRSNITEGLPGLPLRLEIGVVDARSCAPLPNVAVDVWHCDARGVYSGFASIGRALPSSDDRGHFPPPFPFAHGFGDGPSPGGPPLFQRHPSNGKRFLRGLEMTNKDGIATFLTIYPGWYEGRAIHIHLKVHTNVNEHSPRDEGHVCHTGQLFLPEDVSDEVMKIGVYASHKGARMRQREDWIFRSAHDPGVVLSLQRSERSSIESGFVAKAFVGVDPSAEPRAVGPGGGPPGHRPFNDRGPLS